jgi:hypothetical protein
MTGRRARSMFERIVSPGDLKDAARKLLRGGAGPEAPDD